MPALESFAMNAAGPTAGRPTAPIGGVVVWITGLPSSGKSVFAELTAERLRDGGVPCCVLDGDAVRTALVPAPGYGDAARDAFYATLARLAALLATQGMVVLVPATAHRARYRREARGLAPEFVEVYVNTDVAECTRRDAKQLYAAVRAGKASGVPGVDLKYEAPEHPDVLARGGLDNRAAAELTELVKRILADR
jgi:adenylylsulfate kinase